jgi:hypothetical protein
MLFSVVVAAPIVSLNACDQVPVTRELSDSEKRDLEQFSPGSSPLPKQPRPAIPYENHGACPFECCTYRQWTVERDTDVYGDYRATTPVAFRLKRGEKVVALTGVVVTTKLGVGVVTAAIHPNRDVKPGDRLDVIHHLGEGHWKYWFNGHFGEDEMQSAAVCRSARGRSFCEIEMITAPETIWWAKIRTVQGREGWTRDTQHFGNIDACS